MIAKDDSNTNLDFLIIKYRGEGHFVTWLSYFISFYNIPLRCWQIYYFPSFITTIFIIIFSSLFIFSDFFFFFSFTLYYAYGRVDYPPNFQGIACWVAELIAAHCLYIYNIKYTIIRSSEWESTLQLLNSQLLQQRHNGLSQKLITWKTPSCYTQIT